MSNNSPLYYENQIVIENTVGSSIVTLGDAEVGNQLQVSGASILQSTLTVTGPSTLESTLEVAAATTLSDTLAVSGAATLSSDLTVNGLTALEDFTNAQSASTGSLTVAGGVGIAKDVYIGQNLYVQGDRPVLPASFGDIQETTVAFLANVTSRSITGFIFPTANVNSFSAQVTVNATLSAGKLSSQYELMGTQAANGWVLNQKAIGDVVALGIHFQIGTDGQIKYTARDIEDFTTGSLKFRANTTTVDGVYTANTSGSIAMNYSPLDIGTTNYNICQPLTDSETPVITPMNAMSLGQKRVYLGSADLADPEFPADQDVDHGGIVLSGKKDHYILYDKETQAWLTSDNLNMECDTGISICDKKVLDAHKLRIGDRLNQGEIYLGSGEHNTWRIKSNAAGDLSFEYRKLDGEWVSKQTIALDNTDKAGMENNMYLEKRGEDLQTPTTYEIGNAAELTVDLRLTTDDTIVAGRIMKRGATFNGTFSGPLIKVKPGTTLKVNLKNDIDDFGDLAPWNDSHHEYHNMLHSHIDLTQDVTKVKWMAHSMPRGMTDLHFHGVHASPQGLGDNVFRICKPGSSLNYEYEIPADHPGGLYWYHPHAHGESMNQVGRGAAGLILIEGPYQQRLNDAGIVRQFLQFQRVNWKHEAAHDEITWYDYTATLPTDIYNDGNALDAFAPEDLSGGYLYNTDVGKAGGCACGAGTTTRCAVNGCKNGFGPVTPCGITDVACHYLLNGQVQPIVNMDLEELQIWSYINTSTITFVRFSIEGHDIVVVGRDGVPSVIEQPDLASASLDSDWVQYPAGKRLNYLINCSAQRFEFFVIPKDGVTPTANQEFEIRSDPISETGLFADGFASSIKIGTLKYTSSTVSSSATNHISKIEDLMPTSANANADNVPTTDYNTFSYLQAADIPASGNVWHKYNITVHTLLNDGNGKLSAVLHGRKYYAAGDRVEISDTNGAVDGEHVVASKTYNGTLNETIVVFETDYTGADIDGHAADPAQPNARPHLKHYFWNTESHTVAISNVVGSTNPTITTTEAHRLQAGNEITINSGVYTVDAVSAFNEFTIITSNDLTTATEVTYDSINLRVELFNLYALAYFPSISGKISKRRVVPFMFNPDQDIASKSTWMDGTAYDETRRLTAALNSTEEWIMENWSDVVHVFHIHVNNYQVCGYRDGLFGGNNTNNGFSYDYAVEQFVPFTGYEDSTTITAASNIDEVTLSGPEGSRGAVRLRMEFKDYVGIFFMHCHLLDDQDMGMMQIVEVVGTEQSGQTYTPAPDMSMVPDEGYLTDFYGNFGAVPPPHTH